MVVTVTGATLIANAGPDKTLNITPSNRAVFLDGRASSSSDGTIVKYEWYEGDKFIGSSPYRWYAIRKNGTHTITLKVTDSLGNEANDTMVVTVTGAEDGNIPPIANAGEDKVTEINTTITIQGIGTDFDGTIIKYEWKEGSKVLATTPTFTYTVVDTLEHNLTLTVTDDDGLVDSDEVTIRGIKESPDLISAVISPDEDNITKTICATIPESTHVFKKVDIMFLVDVSGSYKDDLSTFRAKANEIINAFEEAGQDVQISLASFSDFPISPYGSASYGDYAFRLDQPLTSDFSLVTTAINNLTILSGNDYPESQLEALFQGGKASTGWRDGALPIIFLATDADFHNSDNEPDYPGHGLKETVNKLVSKGIKVFGLQAGGDIDDVIEIADLTDGDVFSLSSNSAEIVSAIESAIAGTSTDMIVTLEPIGDDGNIIKSITPNIEGAKAGDPIEHVNAGDEVCFNVVFSRGIYASDTKVRTVHFQLRIVAEGVATIKNIPIKVKLSPKNTI